MWKYAAVAVVLLSLVSVLPAAPLPAQQGATVRVIAPTAGATVSGRVTLQVAITGGTVRDASVGDPQAFHYHALVDVDPATVVQAGQPIPTGQANIIHTAETTLILPELAPGQHTVTVILTRTDHVPLNPTVQERVSFTVAGPPAPAASPATVAQQPAPTPAAAPRTGRGGALLADTSISAGALLALSIGMLMIGTLAWRARRGMR